MERARYDDSRWALDGQSLRRVPTLPRCKSVNTTSVGSALPGGSAYGLCMVRIGEGSERPKGGRQGHWRKGPIVVQATSKPRLRPRRRSLLSANVAHAEGSQDEPGSWPVFDTPA